MPAVNARRKMPTVDAAAGATPSTSAPKPADSQRVDVVHPLAAVTSEAITVSALRSGLGTFRSCRGFDDGLVDRVGGCGAGGADRAPASGVAVQPCGSHLGAAGVMYADEQDLGCDGHDDSVGPGRLVKRMATIGAWRRLPGVTAGGGKTGHGARMAQKRAARSAAATSSGVLRAA